MATPALTREQSRAIDRRAIEEFGIPGIVLMENAGRGAVDVVERLGIDDPVVILCGKGNNAGDGFVIARHLDNRGLPVCVLLFARPEELTGDAAVNYHIIVKSGLAITVYPDASFADAALQQELARSACVVDALFGTGLSGAVRPPFERVIAAINGSAVPVVAVDIPSGLDSDTGEPLGPTIKATHTATFVAHKKGFLNPASQQWTGDIHVIDIGAPRVLINEYRQRRTG